MYQVRDESVIDGSREHPVNPFWDCLAHIKGIFYNARTKVKRREHLSEEAKHL